MKIIIIEDTVYKCPESIYKKIKKKRAELVDACNSYGNNELEMHDFILSIMGMDKLKRVGIVEFDFKL